MKTLITLLSCLFAAAGFAAEVNITNIPTSTAVAGTDYVLGQTNGANGTTRRIQWNTPLKSGLSPLFSTIAITNGGTVGGGLTFTGAAPAHITLSNAANTVRLVQLGTNNIFDTNVTFNAAVTNNSVGATKVMVTDANGAETGATLSGLSLVGTTLSTSGSEVMFTNTHSTYYHFYEDWQGGTAASQSLQTSFGGSSFFNQGTSDQQHLGQFVINAASSTTNGIQNQTNAYMLGGGVTYYETAIKLSALGTGGTLYTIDVGVGGNGTYSIDWTDGVWFRYGSDINSGNWQCLVSKSGSTTSSNTATAVTTAWTRLGWAANANGSVVTYFVNGTPVCTNASANMPTNTTFGLTYRMTERSGSGAARQMFVDYIDYVVLFTTPR